MPKSSTSDPTEETTTLVLTQTSLMSTTPKGKRHDEQLRRQRLRTCSDGLRIGNTKSPSSMLPIQRNPEESGSTRRSRQMVDSFVRHSAPLGKPRINISVRSICGKQMRRREHHHAKHPRRQDNFAGLHWVFTPMSCPHRDQSNVTNDEQARSRVGSQRLPCSNRKL